VFSGLFIVEEFDGVGDKVSGGASVADVQTLLVAFMNMSLRTSSFIEAFFPGKKQNFWSWVYPLQVPDYQMMD
jgi:hypothetical protein